MTTGFRAPNWCRQYQWLKKRFPFSGRRSRTVFEAKFRFSVRMGGGTRRAQVGRGGSSAEGVSPPGKDIVS